MEANWIYGIWGVLDWGSFVFGLFFFFGLVLRAPFQLSKAGWRLDKRMEGGFAAGQFELAPEIFVGFLTLALPQVYFCFLTSDFTLGSLFLFLADFLGAGSVSVVGVSEMSQGGLSIVLNTPATSAATWRPCTDTIDDKGRAFSRLVSVA